MKTVIQHIYLVSLLCLIYTIGNFGFAQEPNSYTGKKQFYNINELILIIERARNAGFTDDEIKAITLKEDLTDKTINADAYIQNVQKMEAQLKKQNLVNLKKKYLTVQDIFNDLASLEQNQLKKFRDNLIEYVQ